MELIPQQGVLSKRGIMGRPVPKLIILEGPDCVGKSTQVALLKDLYKSKQIRQPSEENLIGFVRDIVKNKEMDSFSRQLLHTCSHIVDAFTEFKRSNIIMDRCHVSTFVYGELTGVTDNNNLLLHKIHQKVYEHTLNNYDIRIIFLDRETRINGLLTDKFESTFDWEKLKFKYKKFYETLLKDHDNMYLFSKSELISVLDVTNSSIEDVNKKLVEIINAPRG